MSAASYNDRPVDLSISSVRIDGGTQPRVEVSDDVVRDDAEALKAGGKFPPVLVFYDGTDYWLADGFHRYYAHTVIGRNTIAVNVR